MENPHYKERNFWDKYAHYYDFYISKTLNKTYKTILDKINFELMENYHVLEIGTGTGIIPFSIFSKVDSIIATDISSEMILIAKQKKKELHVENVDFQVQDSYKLTFADGLFDMVIASNLLHLIYEPEKALSEVKRVLTDKGVFIAPTFCVGENVKSRIISSIVEFLSGFKTVNKWSIKDFNEFLMTNGFVIEKTVKIDGKFPLAYIVLKKKQSTAHIE